MHAVTIPWMGANAGRLGKSNAMLHAACGRSPPAAGGCFPRSQHAARRRAALRGKALGKACEGFEYIRAHSRGRNVRAKERVFRHAKGDDHGDAVEQECSRDAFRGTLQA